MAPIGSVRITGGIPRSFTYDAAGNITASAGVTYVYDGRGRLKQAGSTTYLVNGLGQRVKKSGASDTFFAYDEAGRLLGEYDSNGTAIQETVWLGDIPVATIRPKLPSGYDVFYVWPDNLNSPRAVSDAANQLRWMWEPNDPFGKTAPNENPAGLGVFNYNLRFPGQYFDAETGTHYNYFRDYDASLGRYIQSDPIGLRAGLNTYGYVGANPLSKSDSKGLLDDGDRGDVQPSGQGHCKLIKQLPIVPTPEQAALLGPASFIFTLCIYKCESFECPPKIWIETTVSNWIWGCQDKRAATGHRGPEGPRRH